MRILYIAKHGQNNADDEGAIEYAFTQFGHTVVRVHERGATYEFLKLFEKDTDMVLFHHWNGCHALQGLFNYVPRVFWCFDLINWDDPILKARNEQRWAWAKKATEISTHGFMTDGDYVAYPNHSTKLHWLPQGADERVMGSDHTNDKVRNILLTCMVHGCGVQREAFVNDLTRTVSGVMHQVKGMYREELRWEIGRSRMVVCPDSPVTHRYWSNRVWNACGFGAFTLHPYCERLAEMYEDGKEIVFYNDREHLHKLVKWWLEDDDGRTAIGRAALERTKVQHTYRHRVEQMLKVVFS